MSTKFAERDNIPKPEGDAKNIRLSGAMAEANHDTTLYFTGAPKDLGAALRAIEYHAGDESLDLNVYARINEKTQKLEVTARGYDKNRLTELLGFAYKATGGCDLGVQFYGCHLDSIKTDDGGNVAGHKYFALTVASLKDEALAEEFPLAKAVAKTLLPIIKKHLDDEGNYKITMEPNGQILVQDRQSSDSQAAAVAEARDTAGKLQALFPERFRTI